MADINNDPSALYDEEFMKKREKMFGGASPDADVSSGRDGDLFSDEQEEAEEKSGGLFSRLRRRKNRKDDFDDDGYDIFDLEKLIEEDEASKESLPEKQVKGKKAKKKKAESKEKTAEDYISVSETADEEKAEKLKKKKANNKKAATSNVETKEEADKQADEEILSKEESPVESPKQTETQAAEEPTPAESAETEETEEAQPSYEPKNIDDINALLESVGIAPVTLDEEPVKSISDDAQATKVIKTDGDNSSTRHFELSDIKSDTKVKPVETSVKQEPERNDGQLILEGYKEEDAPVTESETDVEERLKSTRKSLIDNFRVLAKNTEDRTILERRDDNKQSSITDSVSITDGENIFDAVEKIGQKRGSAFTRLGEKMSVRALQQRNRSKQQKKQFANASAASRQLKKERSKKESIVKIQLIITALLIILSILASAYTPESALDFLFANGAVVFTAVNLVILAVSAAISLDKMKNAVESFRELRPNGDMCLLITFVFVFVQLIISFFIKPNEETGITVFAPFAAFSLLASEYADYVRLNSLLKSVSSITRIKQLMGIGCISNKADAASLGHGISDNGEPSIYYAADTKFPENIMDTIDRKTSDEKYYGLFGIAVFVLGIVFAAAFSIVNKSASYFAVCFVGFICLLMPNLRSTVLSMLYSKANTAAMPYGAYVLSFDSCDEIGKADAFVVDSGDVFEASVSKFRTVPGSRMAQSDAVVYVASTLKKTDSLLSGCFDDYIEEIGLELPEGEDIKYEDGLGYSSWVAGRRVLVGNREMLRAHSIDCPSEEDERRYAKGRSVMYVAVEGKIAATFIVTFSVRGEIRRSINTFNHTGLVLMLKCADAWLNEDNISAKLGADKATIKITGTKGSEIISSYRNNTLLRENSGLLLSKRQKNALALINAAHNLYTSEKLALLINTVGTAISFVFLLLFAVFASTPSFTALSCIIFQLIWAAASYYIGKSRFTR